MFGQLRPPESSVVSCSCGAVLTVRAFTFAERQSLTQRFLDAHKSCRQRDRHCCTGCFQEWDHAPLVDEHGKHAAPDGSRCAGPINCFPNVPLTTAPSTEDS